METKKLLIDKLCDEYLDATFGDFSYSDLYAQTYKAGFVKALELAAKKAQVRGKPVKNTIGSPFFQYEYYVQEESILNIQTEEV